MQETHSCNKSEIQWKEECKNNIYFSHGNTNSRGVAIIIDKNIDCEILNIIRDKEGRYIIINCKLVEKHILLINIYSPTKDNEFAQLEFLDKLIDELNEYDDVEWIMGGDLNLM